jgi:general secretion pathway protein G
MRHHELLKMRRAPGKQRAFTLIEILITLVIVALLSTLALPLAEVAVRRNKEQELRIALLQIRTAIDAYKKAWDERLIETSIGKSGYPASLELLVEGATDVSGSDGKKIYFLRRIPRDPFATDPTLTAAESWGKRSYASNADDPQEGEDIYDIYTKSPGVDLRGIPYREW